MTYVDPTPTSPLGPTQLRVVARDRPRPWYRRARVLAPAAGLLGLFAGVGIGQAGSAAPGTPAAATVTRTAPPATQTAPPVTETHTVKAKVTQRVTRTVAASDAAVQAVLDAWTVVGPQPAKQQAAMQRLRHDWPTLANALDAATGTNPNMDVSQPTSASVPDVYYANCSAARAAGAVPLYRGEPGYRAGLDRDGDGVACE